MYSRDTLVEILSENIVEVVFRKVSDNSLRRMVCTLIPDFLPPLAGSNHKRSSEVIPVWDIEKNAWRSFRLDSLEKEVKILEE